MRVHAATPGFTKTMCGRRKCPTSAYVKQVSCKRCMGGLRNRPEDSHMLHMACSGHGCDGCRAGRARNDDIAMDAGRSHEAYEREERAAVRAAIQVGG